MWRSSESVLGNVDDVKKIHWNGIRNADKAVSLKIDVTLGGMTRDGTGASGFLSYLRWILSVKSPFVQVFKRCLKVCSLKYDNRPESDREAWE